jgi:hypothetical protein
MKITAVFLVIVILTGTAWSGTALARTWTVRIDGSGDMPTIQAAINSASAGDTVLVGPGRYTWSNQGTGNDRGLIGFLRGQNDITVRSETGASTTILDAQRQGRVLYFQGQNHITFEGFTITGGEPPVTDNQGGGIAAHLSSDLIKDCVITGNSARSAGGVWCGGVNTMRFEGCEISWNEATGGNGGGLYYIKSNSVPTLFNCVVKRNTAAGEGGAIFLYRSRLAIENSVLANNTASSAGGAIFKGLEENTTLTNCTLSENISPNGAGIRLAGASDFVVTHTIIANNKFGAGLSLNAYSAMQLSCSDIFGNAGGDGLPAGVVDLGGNFSEDPEFCGVPGTFNYELQADSPCAPGNSPCGLVGAKPVNCGAVPVENRNWGHLKTLYGDPPR